VLPNEFLDKLAQRRHLASADRPQVAASYRRDGVHLGVEPLSGLAF
jgi:hypothetical protein